MELHQQYIQKDGTVVKGATSIIGDNLGWNKDGLIGWAAFEARRGQDYKEIRDRAGRIGTMAHALVEADITFSTDPLFDESEYAPAEVHAARTAHMGFRKFVNEGHLLECERAEAQLTSEKYPYGGTIDFVGTLNGVPYIIDFKTSSRIHKEHRIQLAAYQQLWREHTGKQYAAALLHLDKKSVGYSLKAVDDLSAQWLVFQQLLNIDKMKGKC